jgi:hypothetical protein
MVRKFLSLTLLLVELALTIAQLLGTSNNFVLIYKKPLQKSGFFFALILVPL